MSDEEKALKLIEDRLNKKCDGIKCKVVKNNIDLRLENIQLKKQIDLMADFMYKTGTGRKALSCVFGQNDECNENGCNYCIKQYFADLVEKE